MGGFAWGRLGGRLGSEIEDKGCRPCVSGGFRDCCYCFSILTGRRLKRPGDLALKMKAPAVTLPPVKMIGEICFSTTAVARRSALKITEHRKPRMSLFSILRVTPIASGSRLRLADYVVAYSRLSLYTLSPFGRRQLQFAGGRWLPAANRPVAKHRLVFRAGGVSGLQAGATGGCGA